MLLCAADKGDAEPYTFNVQIPLIHSQIRR